MVFLQPKEAFSKDILQVGSEQDLALAPLHRPCKQNNLWLTVWLLRQPHLLILTRVGPISVSTFPDCIPAAAAAVLGGHQQLSQAPGPQWAMLTMWHEARLGNCFQLSLSYGALQDRRVTFKFLCCRWLPDSNTITGWCQQSTQPCVLPMNKVAEEAVQEVCRSLSPFWTHTPPSPVLSGSQGTFLLIFFSSCLYTHKPVNFPSSSIAGFTAYPLQFTYHLPQRYAGGTGWVLPVVAAVAAAKALVSRLHKQSLQTAVPTGLLFSIWDEAVHLTHCVVIHISEGP